MYRFNSRLFSRLPLMSETAIRNAFKKAFDAWADVSCDGRLPFLVQQGHAVTTTERSELLFDAPNESVVNARLTPEWLDLPDHDPEAMALTMLWFNKRTGEILDVDMELNLGSGEFTDCLQQTCGAGQVDLQNTVTHEAGHLLGLGHSNELPSAMDAQSYTQWETAKRHLSDDDKLGYCALKLPEPECSDSACSCPPDAALQPTALFPSSLRGGCQVWPNTGSRDAARASAASICMLGLGLALRQRRRSRRAKRSFGAEAATRPSGRTGRAGRTCSQRRGTA